MRLVLLAALASSLLALPALGAGGLVVVGWGEVPSSCGPLHLTVQALFGPGGGGALSAHWAVPDRDGPCLVLTTGGTTGVGELQYDVAGPSAGFTFACAGAEASGMTCGRWAALGPYPGPLGRTWFRGPGPDGSAIEATITVV